MFRQKTNNGIVLKKILLLFDPPLAYYKILKLIFSGITTILMPKNIKCIKFQ